MSIFSGLKSALVGKKGTPALSNMQGLLAESPLFKDVLNQIPQRGLDLSNQTLPFTPAQIAQLSQPEQQAASILSGFQAPKYQFNFGQRASDAFGNVGGFLNRAASPITGDEIAQNIGYFMNPYENQVVQNSARDIQEQGNIALANALRRSGRSGAFGSTGEGTILSQVPRYVANAIGDVSANLRQQGFNNASTLGMNTINQNRANAFNAASGYNNLGGNLMNARMNVEALRTGGLNNAINLSNALQAMGGTQRGITQAGYNRDAQINQIPLQQLSLLQSLFAGLPSAATAGTAPTSGLFGSGGNSLQGIYNAGSLVAGMPSFGQSGLNRFLQTGNYNFMGPMQQ